jgi:hypothetical protein
MRSWARSASLLLLGGRGCPLPLPPLSLHGKTPHHLGAGFPLPLFPLLAPAVWPALLVSLLASFLDAISVTLEHVLPEVRPDFLAVLLG